MKRVIVIVLLSIILAMLMSRRENLTPKCDAGWTPMGGLCMGPCPAGYVADGGMCKMDSCPADRNILHPSITQCCKSTKPAFGTYGPTVYKDCLNKTQMRPSKLAKMV